MIIKSIGVIVTCLWSPLDILESAESGSPWLPVVQITSFSGGYLFTSSMSMSIPSGMRT